MTLLAFADESVRPDGDLVSVGGYLFEPTEYDEFCREWRGVMKVTKGVPLHLTNLVNGKRGFENLPLKSRLLAVEVAVLLVNRHALNGISMAISRDEFRKLAPPGEWERRLGSLYSMLCKSVVELACRWLNRSKIDRTVDWTFGAGFETEKEAKLILEAHCKDTDWAKEHRLAKYEFVGGTSPGLQAADLIAWTNTLALIAASIRNREKLQPFIDEVIRLKTTGYETTRITGKNLERLIDINLNNRNGRIFKIPGLAKLKTTL